MIALNFVGTFPELNALIDRLVRIYGPNVTVLEVLEAAQSRSLSL